MTMTKLKIRMGTVVIAGLGTTMALMAQDNRRLPNLPAEQLILCGDQEVFVLDLKEGGQKVWSWRAAEHPEIPEGVRKLFGTTDDCKPVEEGARVLITSSGGGVVLVERASGRALFWASVQDAHSAEMLPRNRVVVAGADANRLALFDLSESEKEIASYPLDGAHGLVWDPGLRCLWALGYRELQAYRAQGLGDRDAGVRAHSPIRSA